MFTQLSRERRRVLINEAAALGLLTSHVADRFMVLPRQQVDRDITSYLRGADVTITDPLLCGNTAWLLTATGLVMP